MSWEELRAIIEENRQLNEEFVSEPPTACPNHGDPLDIRESDGARNCPLGDYRWTG